MGFSAAGHRPRGSALRMVCAWLTGPALALVAGAVLAGPVGAPAGAPFYTRYTAADYAAAPKHLAVAAAPDGQVWIGNIEGVLRFAAGRFELLRLPGDGAGRSLAIGPDGRVYVGSYDRFGYLDERPGGELRYVDLRARFGPGPARFPGEVWDIAIAGADVYFQTDRHLYVLRGDGGTAVLDPGGTLRSAFAVGNTVYCRIEGIGLTRVVDGHFVPVPGGGRFADEGIYDLRGWDGDSLLLMTLDGRFHRADVHGIAAIAPHTAAIFEPRSAYDVVELSDGSLAVGTLGGEVVRLDRDLREHGRFRTGHYPIMQMATDREGGLWIATQGDLVRAQLPSPWSQYTPADGLAGSIEDTLWHRGTRWVATSVGILAGRADARGGMRFEAIPWDHGEAWDLVLAGDELLVAARDGVLRVDAAGATPIATLPQSWRVWMAGARADRAYVPYEPGLAVLARGADGWREILRHEPEGLSVSSLADDGADTLWLGNWRGAPVRLALDPAGTRVLHERRFGPADGLPDPGPAGSHVVALAGRVHVVIGQDFHAWNGQRFEASAADGLAGRLQRPNELQVRTAADGTRYAFTSRELFARGPADAGWRELHPGAGAARGYTEVAVEADGTLGIAGWNALLRYDPQVPAPAPADLRARIESVSRHAPDGRQESLDRSGASTLVLAANEALKVEFALDTAEPRVEFRSRLLGLEREFGPWSTGARREFAALAPRNYTLEVQARTATGREATPAHLSLRVAPAWWQNPWFALGAGSTALLIAATWGRWLAWRRMRRVQARNLRLEALIAERTHELAEANARLQRLATLDGLTGVANRRGFDAALEQRYGHARETGAQLALLMIDVDHFKQFNDRYGHLAGDDALRAIAAELAGFARGTDEVLARFGGEEFALILPQATLAMALHRGEEIRHHFDVRAAAHADGLSVSIGVAAAVPRAGLAPRDLIDVADAALYEAKRNGRNRVEPASPYAK